MKSNKWWNLRAILVPSALILMRSAAAQTPPPPSVNAQQAATVPSSAPAICPLLDSQKPPETTLRIGRGDLLEISVYSFYGAPDITEKIRVGEAGDISIPLVGRVHVAECTAEEAQAIIEEKFQEGQFVKRPHVTILISEYATQGISVLGEVAKPGVYPMLGPTRLYNVLSMAGGLTQNAGKAVTITRKRNLDEQVAVNLGKGGSTAQNDVELFPGDTIVVDKAGVIYVVGDVTKPGGFTVDNNERLTVLQAIALAEGTKPDAALDRAKLIRKTPQGRQELPIPLKKILSAKAADLSLEAEDIVFVPNSAAKTAARRTLDAIVQVTTGVVIYRR